MTLLAYDTPQYTATTGRKKRIPYTSYIESQLPYITSTKKQREDMLLATQQLGQSEKELGLSEKSLGLQEQELAQKEKDIGISGERLAFEKETAAKSFALSKEAQAENKRIAESNDALRREQLKSAEEQEQISQGIQGVSALTGMTYLAHKLGWIPGKEVVGIAEPTGSHAIEELITTPSVAPEIVTPAVETEGALAATSTAPILAGGVTGAEATGAAATSTAAPGAGAGGAGAGAIAIPLLAAIATQQAIEKGPDFLASVMGSQDPSRDEGRMQKMLAFPDEYRTIPWTEEEIGAPVEANLTGAELAQYRKDEVAKRNAGITYMNKLRQSPKFKAMEKEYPPKYWADLRAGNQVFSI